MQTKAKLPGFHRMPAAVPATMINLFRELYPEDIALEILHRFSIYSTDATMATEEAYAKGSFSKPHERAAHFITTLLSWMEQPEGHDAWARIYSMCHYNHFGQEDIEWIRGTLQFQHQDGAKPINIAT